ncbi:MAG: hypothetical protein HKM00_11895 [Gallionella sp.]|nr:hypothetical protein [Gallionella sp.]
MEWLTVTDADNLVTHYVAMFSDLTLRKAADEKIYQLVFYDPLTHYQQISNPPEPYFTLV